MVLRPPSILALALLISACDGSEPSEPTPSSEQPLTVVDRAACLVDPDCDYLFSVGHRGAAGHAPENTLISLSMAEQMGLDVVEIDARPSADDMLVMMHDSTLERTTNGSGSVAEQTLAELRQHLVTSDVDGIDDQPIPTFLEGLLALGPSTLVNVDAKTSRWDLIYADLVAADMLERAWVQTDDLAQTAEALAAHPDFLLMPDASSVEDVEALIPFAPPTIELPLELLEPEPFDACLEAGIKPSQNALGFADAGALVDIENGGDGSAPYASLVARGARIIQTDFGEYLVPALDAMNAERGWARPAAPSR